jgi:large subunit ribosomal protein L29
MKIQSLREKTVADLRVREQEIAEQLFALRLQKVVGQLEKPAKIRTAKRELAQVLTIIREKQSEA